MSGIGPHRIDVQQGNALDSESVARLKPGLTRSQVRFLLGTPLVADPFRDDRWDYVYLMRTAGELTDKQRITLYFDGDTLVRIDGSVPGLALTTADAVPSDAMPGGVVPDAALAASVAQTADATTSIVAPLNPPPADTPATGQALPDPQLATETGVERVVPDPVPAFPEAVATTPESSSADSGLDPVRTEIRDALEQWTLAWSRRDEDAYLAAYSSRFLPQGGGSRDDWEKRRRLLLSLASNIEVRLENASVELPPEGGAVVTFNQFYRSDSYRDAVRKQIVMAKENGRWLILQEQVLNVLQPGTRR